MLKFKNVKALYWDQYSEDEADFDNEVRKGIWFRSDDVTTLPEPPEGYIWNRDNNSLQLGGLQIGRKIRYRLWHNKLGYMPGSE